MSHPSPTAHPRTTIRPIETKYAGCRFRSRTEARWAVAFDHLGIDWDYEPQGYSLPSGGYIPDFYLPSIDAWFEVKPDGAAHDDRWNELAAATGRRMIVARGLPRVESGMDVAEFTAAFIPALSDGILQEYFAGDGWDPMRVFCACHICGKVGIEFSGFADRICRHNRDDSVWNVPPSMVAAFVAARSARFEFGEVGA